MAVGITIDASGLAQTVARFSGVAGKSVEYAWARAMKGLVKRIIDITPPGSTGKTGPAAKAIGIAKISKQMNAVLAPVVLKGTRTIKKVFGETMKNPVTVVTVEKYPDVEALYHRLAHSRASGLGISVGRVGQKYYVDASKYKAMLARKSARVGVTAAQWGAGAAAVGLVPPAFIARHGALGSARKQDDAFGHSLEMTAPNISDTIAGELQRRVSYALRYEEAALTREIDHILGKAAKTARAA